MASDLIDTDSTGCTERYAVPGGWLYRAAWRFKPNMSTPAVDGSALVFVPEGVQTETEALPAPAWDTPAEVASMSEPESLEAA